MPVANVKELLRGYLKVIGQRSLRPLEEQAMKLLDKMPQFFRTQQDNFGLKDIVVEHSDGFSSNTTTEAQFLTRRHLEEYIYKCHGK